jgi:hypothetical protein
VFRAFGNQKTLGTKMKNPACHGGESILVVMLALAIALPMPFSTADSPASVPGGFKYFVGIVGNPSVPDIRWSDEELEQIKSLGVNVVQLSIAWGNRPADEVLNLEDLDAGQREKFTFRIRQAKKHGPAHHRPVRHSEDHQRQSASAGLHYGPGGAEEV